MLLTVSVHHHTQSAQQFELNWGHVRAQQRLYSVSHPVLQHSHFVGGWEHTRHIIDFLSVSLLLHQFTLILRTKHIQDHFRL